MLSADEVQRYSRHLLLPEVGVEGQERLKAARVLVVGVGGLGSPLALYLAAAGIGTLGLVDFDTVDLTNLQRQILHGTGDVGRPKLASATEALRRINPHVRLVTHEVRLVSGNAMELLKDYDVVVDGTDNFATRYLVNDACVLLGKPNVHGSIYRFEGQVSVFKSPEGPCYRCLYPAPPPPELAPSCAEAGVIGVLPGIIGTLQALETLKLVLGRGETLVGRLLTFDALALRFRELKLRKDPDCPLCGEHPTLTGLIDYERFCGTGASETGTPIPEITATELKRLLDAKADLVLIDVREPHEHQVARIPGARLIPLGNLEARLGELPAGRRLVVHCKSGERSRKACRLLLSKGYPDVVNVAGGILQWARVVDPAVKP